MRGVMISSRIVNNDLEWVAGKLGIFMSILSKKAMVFQRGAVPSAAVAVLHNGDIKKDE